jgi:hypothetical protein
MTTRPEQEYGPSASGCLALCPQQLRSLRREVVSLQAAMSDVQPQLGPQAVRPFKMFNAQLAGAEAALILTGSPGAGCTSLKSTLAGAQGGAPFKATTPGARFRSAVTAVDRAFTAGNLLPVRLVDAGEAAPDDAADASGGQAISATATIHVFVLAADRVIKSIDLSLIRQMREHSGHPAIVFVNRIDCLDDPATDIPRIRAQFAVLSARYNTGKPATLVFGSIAWATAAQSDRLAALSEDSKEALLSLAEVADVEEDDHAPSFVWKLSGVPALIEAIGVAIWASPLRRMIGNVRRQFRALIDKLGRTPQELRLAIPRTAAGPVASADIQRRCEALAQRTMDDLKAQCDAATGQFQRRLARLGEVFEQSVLEDMMNFAGPRASGLLPAWETDPFRLRLQIRSCCLGFAQSCRATSDRLLRKSGREFDAISAEYFGAEARLSAPDAAMGSFLSIRSQALNASAYNPANGPWQWIPAPGQPLAAQGHDFRFVHLKPRVQALLDEAMARQIGGPAEMMRQRVAEFLRVQTRALLAQAQQNQPKRSLVNGATPVAGNRSETPVAKPGKKLERSKVSVVTPFPQEP